MMRIAYIINSVEGGGAALPVPAVTDVLRRGGADVRILALTRRDGRAIAPMEAAGLEVLVRDGGEKDHGAALAWLDHQIAAMRPTHLWTSLSRATLLGQLAGVRRRVPVVSWQHAAFLKPGNRRLLRAMQGLSRLWVGDSDAVTRLTADRLKVPAERLVQWSIFRADPLARLARPWRPGETLRIGTLGRLHPVKGYDVLVDALARLQVGSTPIEISIAGDGVEREALEARARSLGVTSLQLRGYTEDPRGYLAGLHLYLQPSRSEGLCVAVHEAMQAGLPVIASAVGQLPYSISAATGALVPPGDAEALATALQRMIADPGQLEGMGALARSDVLDRFSAERFEASGLAILDRMRRF